MFPSVTAQRAKPSPRLVPSSIPSSLLPSPRHSSRPSRRRDARRVYPSPPLGDPPLSYRPAPGGPDRTFHAHLLFRGPSETPPLLADRPQVRRNISSIIGDWSRWVRWGGGRYLTLFEADGTHFPSGGGGLRAPEPGLMVATPTDSRKPPCSS